MGKLKMLFLSILVVIGLMVFNAMAAPEVYFKDPITGNPITEMNVNVGEDFTFDVYIKDVPTGHSGLKEFYFRIAVSDSSKVSYVSYEKIPGTPWTLQEWAICGGWTGKADCPSIEGDVPLIRLTYHCEAEGDVTLTPGECYPGGTNFPMCDGEEIFPSYTGMTVHQIAEPIKEVTPDPVNFGSVLMGNTKTIEVTVKNVGAGTLHICTVSLDPNSDPPFSLGTENCSGADLTHGQTCTIEVNFACTGDPGLYTGILHIPHGDCSDPTPNPINLTGECVPPRAQFVLPRLWPCTPPYHWWFENPDGDTDTPTMTATPNEEVCFYVNYDAFENVAEGKRNSNLSGIGFWVYYNSQIFNDPEIKHIFPKGYMDLESAKFEDDTDDSDNNPTTDKKFLMAWADPGSPPAWPNEPLPLPLFKVCFVVKNVPVLGTTYINFTESDTAVGYKFQAQPMKVEIVRFNIDIDANGMKKPLTDGLLITRYLFGFRGNNLVSGAIDPTGGRTDASKIADWIERGRVEPSPDNGNYVHLDVDQNREVTALTDGIMILRRLFGYTGDNLIAGAIGPKAARDDSGQIASYIDNL